MVLSNWGSGVGLGIWRAGRWARSVGSGSWRWSACSARANRREPAVGFRLQDHRGAWHTLDEARDRKVVVLAFLGAECPLAEAYAPRLAEVAREFEKQGVGFFGVDANQQDGPVAIGRFAEKHGLPFPILKDVGNALADHLGAERTPEVFVLDGSRAVVYRGRVDDQYAIGIHRPSPTRNDLVDALEAVLAGRPVATPRTDAVGCTIGRAAKPAEGGGVTYARDVSRILQVALRHLPPAGRDRPILPDRLSSGGRLVEHDRRGRRRRSDAPLARLARVWQVRQRRPALGRRKKDDPRLGRRRLARGRPGRRDPRRPSSSRDGRSPGPTSSWRCPARSRSRAEGSMPYELVEIDPKLTRDVWVRASQVRPGNPAVVHHVVALVLPPGVDKIDEAGGDFLAAYAPGMPPRLLPVGVAKRVPAGSRIVLQLHYTPRGTKQVDRSRIGLVFADSATVHKELMSGMALNLRLQIPPGRATLSHGPISGSRGPRCFSRSFRTCTCGASR